MQNILNNSQLVKAIRDYRFLLDNNYPERQIMKLIGDRYKLNKNQRTILYRGIVKRELIENRKRKLLSSPYGEFIYFDLLNVVFTISNYLFGRLVFISYDDVLRDAGEFNIKTKNDEVLNKSVGLLMQYVKEMDISFCFFIDQVIEDCCAILKQYINSMIDEAELEGEVLLVDSADKELLKFDKGVIATSDSEIIDNTTCFIVDIPRFLINKYFRPEFVDVRLINS